MANISMLLGVLTSEILELNYMKSYKEVENFIPYWKSEQNHNG